MVFVYFVSASASLYATQRCYVGWRLSYSMRIVNHRPCPRRILSWTGGAGLVTRLQTRMPAITSVDHFSFVVLHSGGVVFCQRALEGVKTELQRSFIGWTVQMISPCPRRPAQGSIRPAYLPAFLPHADASISQALQRKQSTMAEPHSAFG